MEIGAKSGCLEYIAGSAEVEKEMQPFIEKWAADEWGKYKDWWFYDETFEAFFNLDDAERQLFHNQEPMPASFVEKYKKNNRALRAYVTQRSPADSIANLFLTEKGYISTSISNSFAEQKLIKVKCSICGRSFWTNEDIFLAKKRKSCIGAECLKTTVPAVLNSNTSLYTWDKESTALQVLNTQIAVVSEISEPLTFYKGGHEIDIAYISDIHIRHHNKSIRSIAKDLYESKGEADIILFDGDTDDDTALCIELYTMFMRYNDYKHFLRFKANVLEIYCKKREIEKGIIERLECRKARIERYIGMLLEDIAKECNLDDFYSYKNKFYEYESNEKAFSYFQNTKTYKKLNVSDAIVTKILTLFEMYKRQSKYEKKIEASKQDKTRLESVEYALTDYQHHRLENVFVVLGNHELLEGVPPEILLGSLEDNGIYLNEMVSFLKGMFEEIGVKVLHNEFVELEMYGRKYVLYGGTGFAKYEPVYNADRCDTPCSRKQEIIETEKFERKYNEALQYAKDNGAVFICASHYPVTSCLSHCDREAIYFTGHNHRNEYMKSEDLTVYSDNQIGYNGNHFTFKHAKTGCHTNPYKDVKDGLYETTIEEYLKFCRYIGEDVGKGTLLYQRCQNGKAGIYVIKHNGYYGFFIVTYEGNSKGISIVNGGMTKKISDTTDLRWLCENFDVVLSKYIALLLPLRTAQEKISKELKTAGFSGKIHGTIVDIDFYHHIMINPSNGDMQVYYSPAPGIVKYINNEKELIKSIEEISSRRLFLEYGNKYILEMEKTLTTIYSLHPVSLSTGAYGVSRKVNPLQRIFSGHVLRDFDLRLVEEPVREIESSSNN